MVRKFLLGFVRICVREIRNFEKNKLENGKKTCRATIITMGLIWECIFGTIC